MSPVLAHLLTSLHQLRQAATNELKSLEDAAGRIDFLRKHEAELDEELVRVAQRVKDSGAHTTAWNNVETMPLAAKALLSANTPAPESFVEAVALNVAVE